MNSLEKFEKIPNAALDDITAKPAETTTPATSAGATLKNTTTESELLNATANTNIPISSNIASAQDSNNPPPAGTPQGAAIPGNNVAVGQMLEGKLAVELMDALLPGLFVAMFYALNVKLKKSEFQLTQKEKDTLSPLMQNCLNSIALNFNSPWSALAVTAGIIYGSKLTEKGLVSWIDKINEKKESEARREQTAIVVPISQVKQEPQAGSVVSQNISSMQQEVVSSPNPQPFGESEIKRIMKEKSYGRERAIKWLNKKYGIAQ